MDSKIERARNLFIGFDVAALEFERDLEKIQAARKRLVEFHRPCLECGLPVEDDKNQHCNLCKKAREEDPYD